MLRLKGSIGSLVCLKSATSSGSLGSGRVAQPERIASASSATVQPDTARRNRDLIVRRIGVGILLRLCNAIIWHGEWRKIGQPPATRRDLQGHYDRWGFAATPQTVSGAPLAKRLIGG